MIPITIEFNEDRSALFLVAVAEAQDEIVEMIAEGQSSLAIEADVFEGVCANSELTWIHPDDTGDLTEAPWLGVLGGEQRESSGPYGCTLVGADEEGEWYAPIVERWGYPDYQVQSFTQDLLEHGRAKFINQW